MNKAEDEAEVNVIQKMTRAVGDGELFHIAKRASPREGPDLAAKDGRTPTNLNSLLGCVIVCRYEPRPL